MATANQRQIFGWAMFDVANSAYTTVVITVVYSAFFVGYVVPADSEWGNSYWAAAIIISSAMAMLLAPLLGSWIDQYGGKKRMLLATMGLCALATAGLYFVAPGMVWLAITLLVLSNCCWMLSEVFCASFLTDIADQQSMGWISGLGWGLGYLGGLASLILVLFGVITATPQQLDLYVQQHQWAMVAVAAYFVLLSLPTMLWLQEPKPVTKSSIRFAEVVAQSWQQFVASRHLARQLPVLSQFFIIFTIYSAGMATVIKFFGIYVESELVLSSTEKTTVFLALQIAAFIGSIGFGLLERQFGARLTVLLTLLWWLLGLLAIHQLNGLSTLTGIAVNPLFIGCTLLAGAGLGATQSASRTLVGLLSPASYSGQLFGYWGLFARLAAMVGTAAFALVADLLSTRQALLVVMAFFALGAVLISRLPVTRGIEQAQQLHR
ncbi:MFS transporter [uncultured Ferrimonas sp.]|uniref:MFS transporter n=1 Tax=uncultured Ferrimonas sp. TaxID=432640 RepID=UPI0026072941|nr:MFS transporter [uncultured Ferrimonas sp.]